MHPLTGASRSLFLMGLCWIVAGALPAGAAESPLAEANSDFTFKSRPIHPGLVREFQNWLSDYRPPITVTVDVGAAFGTNEYADAPVPGKDGGVSVPWAMAANGFSISTSAAWTTASMSCLPWKSQPGRGYSKAWCSYASTWRRASIGTASSLRKDC